MGGLFGIFRGIFIVTIAVFLMSLSSYAEGSTWKESKLAPAFMNIAGWVENMAPDNVKEKLSTQKQAAQTAAQAKVQTAHAAAADKVGSNLSD
jgi:uncharacterized membrane protein required for colicin V production